MITSTTATAIFNVESPFIHTKAEQLEVVQEKQLPSTPGLRIGKKNYDELIQDLYNFQQPQKILHSLESLAYFFWTQQSLSITQNEDLIDFIVSLLLETSYPKTRSVEEDEEDGLWSMQVLEIKVYENKHGPTLVKDNYVQLLIGMSCFTLSELLNQQTIEYILERYPWLMDRLFHLFSPAANSTSNNTGIEKGARFFQVYSAGKCLEKVGRYTPALFNKWLQTTEEEFLQSVSENLFTTCQIDQSFRNKKKKKQPMSMTSTMRKRQTRVGWRQNLRWRMAFWRLLFSLLTHFVCDQEAEEEGRSPVRLYKQTQLVQYTLLEVFIRFFHFINHVLQTTDKEEKRDQTMSASGMFQYSALTSEELQNMIHSALTLFARLTIHDQETRQFLLQHIGLQNALQSIQHLVSSPQVLQFMVMYCGMGAPMRYYTAALLQKRIFDLEQVEISQRVNEWLRVLKVLESPIFMDGIQRQRFFIESGGFRWLMDTFLSPSSTLGSIPTRTFYLQKSPIRRKMPLLEPFSKHVLKAQSWSILSSLLTSGDESIMSEFIKEYGWMFGYWLGCLKQGRQYEQYAIWKVLDSLLYSLVFYSEKFTDEMLDKYSLYFYKNMQSYFHLIGKLLTRSLGEGWVTQDCLYYLDSIRNVLHILFFYMELFNEPQFYSTLHQCGLVPILINTLTKLNTLEEETSEEKWLILDLLNSLGKKDAFTRQILKWQQHLIVFEKLLKSESHFGIQNKLRVMMKELQNHTETLLLSSHTLTLQQKLEKQLMMKQYERLLAIEEPPTLSYNDLLLSGEIKSEWYEQYLIVKYCVDCKLKEERSGLFIENEDELPFCSKKCLIAYKKKRFNL